MALENGWRMLHSEAAAGQYAKLEEETQDRCGPALNLTDRLGLAEQQQQQHQLQNQNQPQQAQVGAKRKRGSTAKERISKMPPCTAGKRSSIYRGVTRHRWTGRFEAHLWDKGTWNHTQNKKGKQVYLGAYDDEEAAARAYDLAALKYWGPGTLINFPVTDYSRDIEEMQNVSREEYLASLRRKSSGFSRGVSKYRGVARHHHNGRWEARIGRVFGNKYLYLGTYSTQEEAATAYDMAAIEYRGLNAVTNFDLSRYIRWLRPGQANTPGGDNATPVDPASMKEAADAGAEFADEILQVDNKQQQQHSTRVWPAQSTEPYQLPSLGLSTTGNNQSQKKNAPTALGLLLQSNMFRQMLDKTSTSSRRGGGGGGDDGALLGEVDVDEGSQYLVADDVDHSGNEVGGYGGGNSEVEDVYTPFQHDFGLTSSQQDGQPAQDDADGSGLSLWSSFGSSFVTLPLTNAISTC